MSIVTVDDVRDVINELNLILSLDLEAATKLFSLVANGKMWLRPLALKT